MVPWGILATHPPPLSLSNIIKEFPQVKLCQIMKMQGGIELQNLKGSLLLKYLHFVHNNFYKMETNGGRGSAPSYKVHLILKDFKVE